MIFSTSSFVETFSTSEKQIKTSFKNSILAFRLKIVTCGKCFKSKRSFVLAAFIGINFEGKFSFRKYMVPEKKWSVSNQYREKKYHSIEKLLLIKHKT